MRSLRLVNRFRVGDWYRLYFSDPDFDNGLDEWCFKFAGYDRDGGILSSICISFSDDGSLYMDDETGFFINKNDRSIVGDIVKVSKTYVKERFRCEV